MSNYEKLIDKVLTVKLVSGEEIITQLKAFNAEQGDYEFGTPLVFRVMDDRNGQFYPWMATINTKSVFIQNSHILAMSTTIEDLANGYLEATGQSIIAKPPVKKIITA